MSQHSYGVKSAGKEKETSAHILGARGEESRGEMGLSLKEMFPEVGCN